MKHRTLVPLTNVSNVPIWDIAMRQLLLLLLYFSVLGGSTYIGWEWVQKQAYVVFSRQYTQEVAELDQLWNSQVAYPQGRNWLNDLYLQRRWSLLNDWSKLLINFNRKLNLHGDFVETLEKYSKSAIDYRDTERLKFYILELKDRLTRLPKSGLGKNNPLFMTVVSKLVLAKALVEENQKLVRSSLPRVPQLELIFQAQLDHDTTTYCSTHKTMRDRESIIAQMRERCLETGNARLPMCQQGASYFQSELAQLQKLDQWNIAKLKQRWPGWREPACAQE
jgi:hypothetical protein